MADDDCSNCEKKDCKFIGWGYDCYLRTLKIIKNNLNEDNISIIKSAFYLIESIIESDTNADIFNCARYELEEILKAYTKSKTIDFD